MDKNPVKTYHRAMMRPFEYSTVFTGIVFICLISSVQAYAQRSAGARAEGYAIVNAAFELDSGKWIFVRLQFAHFSKLSVVFLKNGVGRRAAIV